MARVNSFKVIDLAHPPSNLGEMASPPQDLPIGELLKERLDLTDEQIAEIVKFAASGRLRFGDAAVALGHACADDVLAALAQQFDYQVASHPTHRISPELVTLSQPLSAQSEAFRGIRSQLTLRAFNGTDARRAVAVLSPDSGEGRTYVCANLAVTLAQLGGRTLVVDADLRGPRLHEIFEVDNRVGLSSLLSGRADYRIIQQVKRVRGLYVLPVGIAPPNPQELIERPTFGMLMRELTLRFDHVVVDTPAAARGADAQVTAARCGAALLIARKDASRVHALHDLVQSLAQGPAQVVGAVMNEF
jgi:chain length determinant protein tyrosine kinase EpsG